MNKNLKENSKNVAKVKQKSLADVVYACQDFMGFGSEIYYVIETLNEYDFTMLLTRFAVEYSVVATEPNLKLGVDGVVKGFKEHVFEDIYFHEFFDKLEDMYSWYYKMLSNPTWKKSLLKLRDSEEYREKMDDLENCHIHITEVSDFYG